jgi:glutathione S-transferase
MSASPIVGTIYHIPVCPFCQRLEILLKLKGKSDAIDFQVVDITIPRPDWLLEKSRGSTALPIFELTTGKVVKESMIIMRLIDELLNESPVASADPYLRAVEGMLDKHEGAFAMKGYTYVMNQDVEKREKFRDDMLAQYRVFNDFLLEHSPEGTFLLAEFGWAEAVYTPFFMRFWFLEYYEGFSIPLTEEYARVRKWINACLEHPAAQQTTKEEIVKVYYDYAKGGGNRKILPGREKSSFVFVPTWQSRPMPPTDKYNISATDAELGLI